MKNITASPALPGLSPKRRTSTPPTRPPRKVPELAAEPDISDFLRWEISSRDTIDFKKIYVDMADGDLTAGVVLSAIVFWHLPARDGTAKLRVIQQGYRWIAKQRGDWWDMCRVTPKKLDRALAILSDKLIEKRTFKFGKDTTLHVRIRWENFLAEWQRQIALLSIDEQAQQQYQREILELTKGKFPNLPKVDSGMTENRTPFLSKDKTKTTSKTTTSRHGENSERAPVAPVEDDDVLLKMLEYGATRPGARRALAENRAEVINRLDLLKRGYEVGNAGAFLCKRDGLTYTPTKEMLAAEAEDATAAAARAEHDRAQEKRRAEQEALAATQAVDDRLDYDIKNLKPAARAKLEAEAKATAPSIMGREPTPTAILVQMRTILRERLKQRKRESSNE